MGRLLLIPVMLGEGDPRRSIPEQSIEAAADLRHFIVEDIRSARRFLRLIDPAFPIDDSKFTVIDKHSKVNDTDSLISVAGKGYDTGLMSEAGMPGIADPGREYVAAAHRHGIQVVPLAGPSSLFLALAASGLNGQSFSFRGYLPIKPGERAAALQELEKRSKKGESQIFMETPYRNNKLIDDIIRCCNRDTLLCIAAALTLDNEYVETKTIGDWEKRKPDINKIPAIFIIQA